MSNDYTSQIVQWIMDQAAAGQPQPIPQYDVDPDKWVQDAARRENLYQDTLSDSFDFANSAAAGPSAFAPGAFDSTSTYTPVEQQGTQALRAYAARGDTPEGIIAQGILAGSTAQAEIALLQAAYAEAEKNGTLADNPILSKIPMGPPSDYDGAVRPDWEGLQTRMGDVESAYFTEAQGGTSGALFDPVTGEFVGGGNRQMLLDENGNPVLADVETSMSEAAQRFADQGLSLPTDQFTPADLMDPNQAQYMPQIGGLNDAWLQAMQNWQAETMALPAQDPGKAGQSATALPFDKGQQQAAAGDLPHDLPFDNGPSRVGFEAPQLGASMQEYLDFVNHTPWGGAGPNQVLNAVGTWEDIAGTDSAAQGQPGSQNRPGDQEASLTIRIGETPEQTYRRWVESNPQQVMSQFGTQDEALSYIVANQDSAVSGVDLSTVGVGPNFQASDPFVLPGGGAQPGGVGGGGAGGTGGPRSVSDLTGTVDGGAAIDQGQGQPPIDANTLAMLRDTLTPLQVFENQRQQQFSQPATTSDAAYLAAMKPHPDQYAVQSGRMSRYQARPPSINDANTLAAMSQMLTPLQIFENQRDQYFDQTAPNPNSPSARTNNTPTSPVRIGKGRQDRRTNAPTVRDRYPKPKARDTAQSRMAQENANAAWQRTRAASRAAGIGTGAYGRAAAAAYLLQQAGITPLTTQQAARRAAGNAYR